MNITEAIAGVYLRATGKTTTLTAASSKYGKIIGLLDHFQRTWAREPGVDWNSLYNPSFSIGNVTATDTYDLDTSTIRKLSDREGDYVRIMWTDGEGYTDYTLVTADSLKDYYWGQNKESYSGRYAARIGGQLVFNHTFTSDDPEFGGDIQVPCYVYPEAISANSLTDDIQVDDPDWLVIRCAAEYVRTDITRQNQYPNLLNEANERMGRMKDDNDAQKDDINTPWTPLSGIGAENPWN